MKKKYKLIQADDVRYITEAEAIEIIGGKEKFKTATEDSLSWQQDDIEIFFPGTIYY